MILSLFVAVCILFTFTFHFHFSIHFYFSAFLRMLSSLVVVCILSRLTHSLFTFQFTLLLGSSTWWFSHSSVRSVFYSLIRFLLLQISNWLNFQMVRYNLNVGRAWPCCCSGHLQLPWWLGERGDFNKKKKYLEEKSLTLVCFPGGSKRVQLLSDRGVWGRYEINGLWLPNNKLK